MKSSIVIFLFATSLCFFSSCKKKCDCDAPNQIEGTWHMKSVSGGLAGVNISYANNEVTWAFSSNTLVVSNALNDTDSREPYTKLKTGTYSYATKTENAQKVLLVNGVKMGDYSFNVNELLLDDGVAADGLLTVFER